MIARIVLSLAALGGLSALSGCVSISDEDWTRSAHGTGPASLGNEQTGDIGNFMGTVNYRSGTDGDGAAAFAAFDPEDAILSIGGGVITYDADFEIAGIQNIRFTATSDFEGFIAGTNFTDAGSILLSGNFDNGTLTGESGDLAVDGTFGLSELGGAVTYRGVSGSLDGLIAGNGVIGAFHGNSDELVYGGGFAGTPVVVD